MLKKSNIMITTILTTTAVLYNIHPQKSAAYTLSSDYTDNYYTVSLQNDKSATNDQPKYRKQPEVTFPANDSVNLRDKEESMKNEISNDNSNTITVTGTLIRGIGASAGAQPVVVPRDEIISSGYATVHQALQTLPQVFSGSITEHKNSTSSNGIQNFTASASPDLRGLGPKATLYLVNGRRLPSTHINTVSIDISSLPLAAIERIEVLPDGASAVYGSDAVAGVINVILRRDYDGTETNFRYGRTTEGRSSELSVSQIMGADWSTGNIITVYEYYRRTALHHDERDFSRSDDLRRFGGSDHRIIATSPGNIANLYTFSIDYGIPPNQNGRQLTRDDLLPSSAANTADGIAKTDLIPAQKRHSIYITGNQEIADQLSIFVEGRYTNRRVRNLGGASVALIPVSPTHPYFVDAYGTGEPYYILYNFINDLPPTDQRSTVNSYNAVLGIEYDISNEFQLRAYANYSKEKTKTRRLNEITDNLLMQAMMFSDANQIFNPYGDGSDNNPTTLKYISPPKRYSTNADIAEFNAIVDGPLTELPGGELRLAFGASYRHDEMLNKLIESRREFKRDVYAAFAELFFPFFSENNRVNGVESLEVSISARFERYADHPILPKKLSTTRESSFNPKIGVRWEFIPGIIARGSYGTSFAMPSLQNRITSTSFSVLPLNDSQSPTGISNVLIMSGTAPDLRNETATTWSVGLNIAPKAFNGARLNLSYFSVHFKDQITDIFVARDILSRENEYQDVITRNPSTQMISAACATADDLSILPHECQNPNIVDIFIDARTRNQAKSIINGIDLDTLIPLVDNQRDQFRINASATYLIDHKYKLTDYSPAVSRLNTYGNPIDFRLRFTALWRNLSGISSQLSVNYQDSYKGPFFDDFGKKIKSWTTVDWSLSYSPRREEVNSFLQGVSVTLSCLNVFDKNPPFADVVGGFDANNANPLGRFISLNVSKQW